MTARHKLLLCCFLLAICPPFLYCKLFCRQDGGIVPPFFIPHQPSQNRTIPRKLPTPLPYERSVCFASCKTLGVQLRASMPLYERSVCFASLRNSGRSTSGIHTRPLSKVRCCRSKKIRATTGGIALHPPTLPKPHYPSLRTTTLALK